MEEKKRGRKERKKRERKGAGCRAGNELSYSGSARARLEKSSARA